MSTHTRPQSQFLERVAAHGIVGAGGAGFPTHVKLASPAECIILNGAECEPLLHKDKEILRHCGEQVMAGLAWEQVNERLARDAFGVLWDCRTEQGNQVSSGVYYYLITDDAGHKAKGRVAVLR